MTLGLMVVIGFVLIVLFFNGSQIKKPLSSYLSAKTGFEVTIGDAEFSPLYPDVIKLYDVSFGNSKLGELYLEYDLRSALSEERLEINDLYLNGVTITPEDLKALAANRLGYHSIYATLVRFHHTPVKTQFLHTKDATIRLNNVGFTSEQGLTFRSGAIAAPEAELLESPVKDLALQFARDQEGLSIENFTAAMLGGMVSGQGRYLPHDSDLNTGLSSAEDLSSAKGLGSAKDLSSAEGFSQSGNADLIFDELNLSKVILHNLGRPKSGINLSARTVNLSQVIYTNDQQALTAPQKQDSSPQEESQGKEHPNYHVLVMQGISGKLHDLELGHDRFSARFDGAIDALSFPNLQTSFEHNQGTAQLKDAQLSFDFKGTLYEGNYHLKGTLDRAHQELSLDEVKLEKSKLALNPPRLDFLQNDNAYTIKLAQGSFENLEFLSFLNQLPLSIQSISGSATNLQWGPSTKSTSGNKSETTPATILGPLSAPNHGELKLNLHNLLYSNLLVSDLELKAALTPKQLQVNLPQVKLKEARLSASSTLSLSDTGMSTLALEAQDFESADLNSNLIGHMLTGKINLNAQLTSSFTGWQEQGLKSALLSNLSGRVHLDSQGLLISDLGLDLINGGKKQDYTLSGTELLAALQGSVAGINELEADTTFQGGRLSTQGHVSLATANSSFSVNIDLLDHDFSGNAFMVSLARDSTTTVSFDGTTEEPQFAIRALSRGAQRPGLYLPQYDAMAQAKEQTDAKGVLNGTVVLANASSAVAQSAAASDAPEQISDTPLGAETTQPEAASSDQPEAAISGEPTATSDQPETATSGAPTATSDQAEPQATADAAATAPNAAETKDSTGDLTKSSESATKSEATTKPEDIATAENTGPASEAAGTPAPNESSASESEGKSVASSEAAKLEAPAAETSAPASAQNAAKTQGDTALADDAAAISALESEVKASDSNNAEPSNPEAPAAAEISVEQAPANEADAGASDAAQGEADTAAKGTDTAPEDAAGNAANGDSTAPESAPAEASAAEDKSDAAANSTRTDSELNATEDTASEAPADAADAGASDVAQSEADAAAKSADAATEDAADGSADATVNAGTAATEGAADSAASSDSAAPESAPAAVDESVAAGESVASDAAPNDAATAAQTEAEVPDAAAQAQADQTEFELLKDVFIDSFIQHEHGTAAEEEAAQAAAQKDAATRKQAEERPYDPEEEMIF